MRVNIIHSVKAGVGFDKRLTQSFFYAMLALSPLMQTHWERGLQA
jgi:hypothetical protein